MKIEKKILPEYFDLVLSGKKHMTSDWLILISQREIHLFLRNGMGNRKPSLAEKLKSK
jgi:hypothetical protein